MRKPRLRLPSRVLLALAPFVVTSCGGDSPTSPLGPDFDPFAATLEITVSTFTLTWIGDTVEVQVTAKNTNGDVLTGKTFTWSSSNENVVTVSVSAGGSGTASIVVTAVGNGTAEITVSTDDVEGSTTVTVSQVVATIEITPTDPVTLTDQGETRNLMAVSKDAGGTEIAGVTYSWLSDDEPVATVALDGTVTAVSDGVAKITASASGVISNAVEVTVALGSVITVEVTPVGPLTLTSLGATERLTAIAKDVVDEIVTGVTFTWASDNEAAATVSPNGTVTAVADGVANVTASVPGVPSNVVEVTVAQSVAVVEVTPANDTVLVANTTQLTAQPKDAEGNAMTGRTVTWSTGNPNIATVDGNGLVTGIGQGIVAITARSEGVDGFAAIVVITNNAVASLVVAPATDTIGIGQELQLEAELRDEFGTVLIGRVVTWVSDDVIVATVDANGVMIGLTAGVVTITGTSEGVSGTSTITMVPVSVASVVVTPANGTVQVGQTLQLAAEPRDSTGTPLPGRAVAWSTSAANIASVDGAGVVFGVATGAATITASSEGVLGTASITVAVPPSAFCADNPPSAIATLDDANLEAAVRAALGIGAQDDLTCGLVAGLTSLTANDAGITSLVGIQNLTSLTSLDLGGNSISNILSLIGVTSLTALHLNDNLISDISLLGGLTSLTTLHLSANSISDISSLGGLTSLTTLALDGGNSVSDISALSGLTSLTSLFLNHNSITNISALSGITGLTVLALGGNTISDFSALSGLTSLTTLVLFNNSVGNITVLSGLTSLTTLLLQNNSITDISPLSGLTNLTDLNLSSNPDLANIQPLLDNSGLAAGDEVDLTGTNVSCTDVTSLQAKGVTVTSTCTPAPGITALWVGGDAAGPTDWSNENNWLPVAVPTASDSVLVQSTASQPTLTASVSVVNLTVEDGADLNTNGFTITVSGSVDAGSSITGTGTVVMTGSGVTVSGSVPNLTVSGSVTLGGATSVTGNVTISDTLNVSGHKLTVAGDLSTENLGRLVMRNVADTVDVAGNVLFRGQSTDGLLTAGVMLVEGNFTQITTVTASSFAASGTHKVVLDGSSPQTVSFNHAAATWSHFQALEIANTSADVTMSSGPWVTGDVTVSTAVTVAGTGTLTVGGDLVTVAGSDVSPAAVSIAGSLGTTAVAGTFAPALTTLAGPGPAPQVLKLGLGYQSLTVLGPTSIGGALTLPGDFTVSDDVTITGALAVSGDLTVGSGGKLPLGGATSVTGNVTISDTLNVSGHKLTVAGDLSTENLGRLVMRNVADTVDVAGNVLFRGQSTDGLLTAGVMLVEGNFTQITTVTASSFAASGTHKVVLDGSSPQTVSFNHAAATWSHFQALEIANTSADVTMSSGPWVTGDVTVSTAVTVAGTGTLTVGGDLVTVAGSDVSPAAVSIAGSLGTTAVAGTFAPALTTLAGPGPAIQVLKLGLGYQNVTVNGPASIPGAFSLPGDFTISDDVTITGALTVSGDLTVGSGGKLPLGGATSVTGNVTISDTG